VTWSPHSPDLEKMVVNDTIVTKTSPQTFTIWAANLIVRKYILLHFLAILFIFHWNITFVQGVTFLELLYNLLSNMPVIIR